MWCSSASRLDQVAQRHIDELGVGAVAAAAKVVVLLGARRKTTGVLVAGDIRDHRRHGDQLTNGITLDAAADFFDKPGELMAAESGKKNVLVAGVDGLSEAINAIQNGDQYVATALNDPRYLGEVAIEAARGLVSGKTIPAFVSGIIGGTVTSSPME